MKSANAILAAVVLTGLAGCSDAPSENDVKQTLVNMTGDCTYFTITHVLKVNWPLPGTTDYQVDMQYSIQSAPLPGAKDIAAPLTLPLAALNARLKAAESERDKNYKTNADFLDRIERAQHVGDDQVSSAVERQRQAFVTQKLDPGVQLARELAAEKVMTIKQASLPLRAAFFKACPNTTPAVYDQVYDNTNMRQYVRGRSIDFATSIRMSKTANGWQIKEQPAPAEVQ
jgi:hypothetical protein